MLNARTRSVLFILLLMTSVSYGVIVHRWPPLWKFFANGGIDLIRSGMTRDSSQSIGADTWVQVELNEIEFDATGAADTNNYRINLSPTNGRY